MIVPSKIDSFQKAVPAKFLVENVLIRKGQENGTDCTSEAKGERTTATRIFVNGEVTMSRQQGFPKREVVGVFSRPEDLQDAIDDLLSSGFDRANLSLLASEHAVEKKLGHRYEKVRPLEDDQTAPRAAYVSTEAIGDAQGSIIGGLFYVGATAAAGAIVASGGTLAAAIVATVLTGGAGGLIGAVLARWIGDHHANILEEQLNHGGLLLWVRTSDGNDESRAVEILGKHSSSDVHAHALSAQA